MQTLYDVLVWVHVAAWASALVLWATTWRSPRVPKGMWHAIATAMVIGVVLTGIGSASASVHDPNNVKVAVKFAVALAAVAVAMTKQKEPAPNPWGNVAGGLVLLNVVLAYAWR